MANQTILRISKEIAEIQKASDLSIAVACQEADVRHITALIIGPPDTPYEYGFFEFRVTFGPDYPSQPPKVDAMTTNHGQCRFSPNIYSQGKVCLSILGTWRGEEREAWSSAQGLESVLLSIQSLMSKNPYENEPGYENHTTDSDKAHQAAYVAKILHETLRIAVIQKLEDCLDIKIDGPLVSEPSTPQWEDTEDDEGNAAAKAKTKARFKCKRDKTDPFKDLYKRRFLWYYDTYLMSIEEQEKKQQDGAKFETMPFEMSGNTMAGSFGYEILKTRLIRVREVIDMETQKWAEEGAIAVQHETGTAANLQRQFEQLVEHNKLKKVFNLDVKLKDENPFVWIITYFGKPMTKLDGGVFRIMLSVSPRFPDEQPRARMETSLYHHRVSAAGVVCYFPKKLEEMRNHVETIIESLEDESPPYDPRTIVNPSATKLLWGSEDDKKKYKRALRRSVQQTMEEL